MELFDWVRALDEGHPLQSLLDVYPYTAMISLCINEHDVERALKVSKGARLAHLPGCAGMLAAGGGCQCLPAAAAEPACSLTRCCTPLPTPSPCCSWRAR